MYPLDAADPGPDPADARAGGAGRELKCPVCRSQSVRTSRSFMAEDMSRQVRRMVAEGKSKEQVREYFVSRYGDYIVLAPRKEGFAWTVWLLPFALVLGGSTYARGWGMRVAVEDLEGVALLVARLDHKLGEC